MYSILASRVKESCSFRVALVRTSHNALQYKSRPHSDISHFVRCFFKATPLFWTQGVFVLDIISFCHNPRDNYNLAEMIRLHEIDSDAENYDDDWLSKQS